MKDPRACEALEMVVITLSERRILTLDRYIAQISDAS